MGTDEMGAREAYREVIYDNIEYEHLLRQPQIDREQLDEIAALIVDTVCSGRKAIRIAGDDHPAEAVKSRFLMAIAADGSIAACAGAVFATASRAFGQPLFSVRDFSPDKRKKGANKG